MPVVSTRLAHCKYIPFNDLRLALCGLTAIPGQFGTQVQHHEWKIYTVISPLVTCVHRALLAIEGIAKLCRPLRALVLYRPRIPSANARWANEWHR